MTNLISPSELESTFKHVTKVLEDNFQDVWDLGWGDDEDCRPKKRGRKRSSEKQALLDKLMELAS